MDIQTKINLCMTADFKDWGYYKAQEKIRELKELIEKITDENALKEQKQMDESCNNCKRCLDLEILDYSQGGCKNTEVTDDFICLAFAEEGKACLMHGTTRNDVCECWQPKN